MAEHPGLWMGEELRFPADIVTETVLIIAKRGSGKTYSASVLVEEMVGVGLPVCVLDPLGVWWGLRSSADGKSAGLPVIIIGGEHADLPLPADGALVADLVIDERVPVVIDLSELSKTRQRAFVCSFLEKLYHRNREPLHVVIDEADLFAPLRGGKDTMRLLGAYEDIVRRGRARGLGCTSITQRPAVLHTDIRSQAEVLIALRLIGTHDVAAIDEWVRLHATDEEARAVKASLPSLPVGTAWVWSPGWLELLMRVKIRQRLTFDSSATPKVGQQRIVPRAFAPVDQADLDRLIGRLKIQAAPEAPARTAAASAELVRLRQRNAELEAALKEALAREPERIEVPVLTDADRERMDTAYRDLHEIMRKVALAAPSVEVLGAPPQWSPPPSASSFPVPKITVTGEAHGRMVPPKAERIEAAAVTATEGTPALGKRERSILTVLAQYPGGRNHRQIALLTGYSPKASTIGAGLSTLRKRGYVSAGGSPVLITQAGVDALGDIEPLPSGPALLEYWYGQLGARERALLAVLLDHYPETVTHAVMAERTGYSPDASTIGAGMSKIRGLGLADGWAAAADFVEAIR